MLQFARSTQPVYDTPGELLGQPFGGGIVDGQRRHRRLWQQIARASIGGGCAMCERTIIYHFPGVLVLGQCQMWIVERQQEAVIPLLAERAHNIFEDDEIEYVAVGRQRPLHLDSHAIVVAMQRLTLALKRNKVRGAEAKVAALNQHFPGHPRLTDAPPVNQRTGIIATIDRHAERENRSLSRCWPRCCSGSACQPTDHLEIVGAWEWCPARACVRVIVPGNG